MTESWQEWQSWFNAMDWSLWGVWTLTTTLFVAGLLGTFLPLIPGPLLIFIGCALHSFLRPQSGMSWLGLGLELLLVILAYALDFLSGALGTRWFGGSRWGIAGVLIGGLVGLFFPFPGLILGPIIGAFTFEMLFARKTVMPAAKATWGSILGTGLGMVGRIVIAVVMVILFYVDALWL